MCVYFLNSKSEIVLYGNVEPRFVKYMCERSEFRSFYRRDPPPKK